MKTRLPLKPLTSLRFFAALLVVLLHAYDEFSGALVFRLPEFAVQFISSGSVAVSLFFVLSGFILCYNYLDQDLGRPRGLKDFWSARLARIYPVYLVGLCLAAPKFFFSPATGDRDSASTLLTSLAALTMTQAWIPELALAWNGPGWSLSAEAFFYLLFPFAALWVRRLGSRRLLLTAMAVCWLATLFPAWVFEVTRPLGLASSAFFKYNPLLRLPEFLMGMCLGKLFLDRTQNGGTAFRGTRGMLALSAVLIGGVMCGSHWLPKIFVHNGLGPLFALLVFSLAGIASQPSLLNRLGSLPFLVLLGESSYALYILHVPIKGLFLGAIRELFPIALANPSHASFIFLGYLGCTLCAAILTYKFIEVPARRIVKAWFSGPAARSEPGLGTTQAVPRIGWASPTGNRDYTS